MNEHYNLNNKQEKNADIDTSLAVTLREIGRCLQGMNQHDEALHYFEKVREVEQRETTNVKAHKIAAIAMHWDS